MCIDYSLLCIHYCTVAVVLHISTVVSGVVQRVDNSTGAVRRDQTNTVSATLTTFRERRISVLNHCLEWDKFIYRDVNEAKTLRERERERGQSCEDEDENETKVIFRDREREQHYENENENETSETE